jgi:hypothetical protein
MQTGASGIQIHRAALWLARVPARCTTQQAAYRRPPLGVRAPDWSAVRLRRHQRVHTPPEQIPLGACSNLCVAVRWRPGRTPHRVSRRRGPLRLGRRAPLFNSLTLPSRRCPHTPSASPAPIKGPRARTPPRWTAIAAAAMKWSLRPLPQPANPPSTSPST